MFGASVPEKPIIDVKAIEKTGRRNLPILQEEESFRILVSAFIELFYSNRIIL